MRKSIILDKDEKIKDKKNSEDDEAQWSLKRIVLFLSILGVILFFLYYFITVRVGSVLGEKDIVSKTNGPQINLPQKNDIENLLRSVEESVSQINTEDIVSSQPQIQDAIKQLEKLTNKDNFKEMFCSSICKN